MTHNKPEGAHRCEAYKECAYWAFQQIGDHWYCDQCASFLRKMQKHAEANNKQEANKP